ncbi:MAG: DEAD/DEAH box helicase [Deltaproteobacteria bacterium]|nr:DEAD/DEAH box helicase [Deltaproteobacteria bacterium]
MDAALSAAITTAESIKEVISGAFEAVVGDPTPEVPAEPAPPSWDELGMHADVKQALDDMGYFFPTPVQTAVFKPVSEGKDLLVQARTGTGKTTAFGLPTINNLIPTHRQPQVLILCPTRELALQVARELTQIGKHRGVIVETLYGGAPIGKQIASLKNGVHVVVGTPGRVLDHIGRRTLNCSTISQFILDECDEMLSMGFLEDIERVVAALPEKKQTMLFSATMPDEVSRYARRHMKTAETLSLSRDSISVSDIHHAYYIISGIARSRDLLKIIYAEEPESAIIFCNLRDETTMVAKFLQKQGLDAEPLSSDLSQADRERVMGRMKAKNLRFLCATDVAARGIDISNLSHVINYSVPEQPEIYVHRTGRTGRAGKKGTALSMVGPRELGNFRYVRLTFGIKPEERLLPKDTIFEGKLKVPLPPVGIPQPPDPVQILIRGVAGTPTDLQRQIFEKLLNTANGKRVLACLVADKLDKLSTRARPKRSEHSHSAEGEHAAPSSDRGGDRPERTERTERPERGGYGERPERGGYGDRPDRGARGGSGGSGGSGGGRFERDGERPRFRDRDPDRTERFPRPNGESTEAPAAGAIATGGEHAPAGERGDRERRPWRDRNEGERTDRFERPAGGGDRGGRSFDRDGRDGGRGDGRDRNRDRNRDERPAGDAAAAPTGEVTATTTTAIPTEGGERSDRGDRDRDRGGRDRDRGDRGGRFDRDRGPRNFDRDRNRDDRPAGDAAPAADAAVSTDAPAAPAPATEGGERSDRGDRDRGGRDRGGRDRDRSFDRGDGRDRNRGNGDRNRDRDRGPRTEESPVAQASADVTSADAPAVVAESERNGERDRGDRDRGGRDRGRDRDRRDSTGEIAEVGTEAAPAVETIEEPATKVDEVARAALERADRGGKAKGKKDAAPTETREFWETWAEEKSTRPASEPAPAAAADSGEAKSEERPARGRSDRGRGARSSSSTTGRDTKRRSRDDDDKAAKPASRTKRDTEQTSAPAAPAATAAGADSQARLFISLGKKHGVSADDLRQLLAGPIGGDKARIGSVSLRDSHAHVRVPEDLVDSIIAGVNGTKHEDHDVTVERSRA